MSHCIVTASISCINCMCSVDQLRYSAHQKIRWGDKSLNPLQLATDLLELVKVPVLGSD